MEYKCLNQQVFEIGEYSLQSIQKTDFEKIRIWRNEQMEVLRQKTMISEEMQTVYFQNQIEKTFNEDNPNQILFGYFKDNNLIGYGGIVHISWEDKRGEVSFLLNTEYSKSIEIHCKYFENYLKLIEKVGFEVLKFHKLTAEVYDVRKYHNEILLKCGFIIEGVLKEQIIIKDNFVDSIFFGKINSK